MTLQEQPYVLTDKDKDKVNIIGCVSEPYIIHRDQYTGVRFYVNPVYITTNRDFGELIQIENGTILTREESNGNEYTYSN